MPTWLWIWLALVLVASALFVWVLVQDWRRGREEAREFEARMRERITYHVTEVPGPVAEPSPAPPYVKPVVQGYNVTPEAIREALGPAVLKPPFVPAVVPVKRAAPRKRVKLSRRPARVRERHARSRPKRKR